MYALLCSSLLGSTLAPCRAYSRKAFAALAMLTSFFFATTERPKTFAGMMTNGQRRSDAGGSQCDD